MKVLNANSLILKNWLKLTNVLPVPFLFEIGYINGHNSCAYVKVCSSLPVVVTSSHEWKIIEWDKKKLQETHKNVCIGLIFMCIFAYIVNKRVLYFLLKSVFLFFYSPHPLPLLNYIWISTNSGVKKVFDRFRVCFDLAIVDVRVLFSLVLQIFLASIIE